MGNHRLLNISTCYTYKRPTELKSYRNQFFAVIDSYSLIKTTLIVCVHDNDIISIFLSVSSKIEIFFQLIQGTASKRKGKCIFKSVTSPASKWFRLNCPLYSTLRIYNNIILTKQTFKYFLSFIVIMIFFL